MSWLVPLPLAVPLLSAAALLAGSHVLPRRAQNAIAIAAAATATVFAVLLMLRTERGDVLHWFGGWTPRGTVSIGIDFTADPFGAGLAALACGVVLCCLVYSSTFMHEASGLFDVLVLVFCGAMCGFALTGDLFNMFVWFELMGVAAYALAGFEVRELGPVQGAFNFAITNTVGAYALLLGIGLLYGRTGALNLAQMGKALAGSRTDGLLVVAITLVVVGFLVKAAAVPFHMWAADAHAVAPSPVAALFSALELQLGLFAIARVYWTVFDAPFGGHRDAVRDLLLAVGLASALLGAVMCFLQRHLKRLLAYSTISHSGIILVGIALLDPKGLAGGANLVLSHAFLKGGLFLVVGVLLALGRSVDELRLHGRCRQLRFAGLLFGLGGLGLIGLPYVGSFLGHSLVDDAATREGLHWIVPLTWIAAAISAGTILRAGARVFLGWGPRDDDLLTTEPPEEPPERTAVYGALIAPATVMIALGLAASLVPGLQQRTEAGAEHFRDRAAYVGRVLGAKQIERGHRLPYAIAQTPVESWVWGLASGGLAVLVAAFGLWRHRLPAALRARSANMLGPPVRTLKLVHSGIVGDYLMWITVGTAVIGGVWALTLK
jgi:multicomponent Na+:H+ antiporter subunit D